MTKNHKRGDIREDGMIFWRYVKKLNKEVWLTLEQFDLTKIKSKINRNKCYVNNYKKERA